MSKCGEIDSYVVRICFHYMAVLAGGCIGIVGIQGIILNPALGWIAFGIGSGLLLNCISFWESDYRFFKKNWKVIAWHFMAFGGLSVVGVLGTQGLISTQVISWSLIGNSLLAIAIASIGYIRKMIRPEWELWQPPTP